MTVVTVHQAKTQLSKLIAQAMTGEDVVIANGVTPKVRLTPVNPVKNREFGALKGVVSLDDSFFEPLPADELAAWGES
jgi:prevent-host-death family protein